MNVLTKFDLHDKRNIDQSHNFIHVIDVVKSNLLLSSESPENLLKYTDFLTSLKNLLIKEPITLITDIEYIFTFLKVFFETTSFDDQKDLILDVLIEISKYYYNNISHELFYFLNKIFYYSTDKVIESIINLVDLNTEMRIIICKSDLITKIQNSNKDKYIFNYFEVLLSHAIVEKEIKDIISLSSIHFIIERCLDVMKNYDKLYCEQCSKILAILTQDFFFTNKLVREGIESKLLDFLRRSKGRIKLQYYLYVLASNILKYRSSKNMDADFIQKTSFYEYIIDHLQLLDPEITSICLHIMVQILPKYHNQVVDNLFPVILEFFSNNNETMCHLIMTEYLIFFSNILSCTTRIDVIIHFFEKIDINILSYVYETRDVSFIEIFSKNILNVLKKSFYLDINIIYCFLNSNIPPTIEEFVINCEDECPMTNELLTFLKIENEKI